MTPLWRGPGYRAAIPYLLVAAATFAARAFASGLPPNGTESLHYAVASEFGQEDPDISGLIWWFQFLPRFHLWARPAFYAALWAPAQVSLDAARFAFTVVSCGLPLLLLAVLRRLGTSAPIAVAAALVPALHPAFVLTSVRIEPVQWACVALLGSIWCMLGQRSASSAILLALAIGFDRIAIPGAVAIAVHSLREARERGQFSAWPIRASPMASGHLLVVAATPLPLVYSALHTWGFWSATGPVDLIEACYLGGWLLLPLAAGLRIPAARRWVLTALVYPMLFLISIWFLKRTATAEQTLVAIVFSLLGAAVAMDWLIFSNRRPQVRGALRGAGAVLATIVLASVFTDVPDALDAKHTTTLHVSIERARDWTTWHEASTWLQGADRVLLIDIPLETLYYPFHFAAPDAPLQYVFASAPENLSVWIQAIENPTTSTLVLDNDQPLNLAVRDAYADCIRTGAGGFTLIEGGACPGRGQRLYQALLSRSGVEPP